MHARTTLFLLAALAVAACSSGAAPSSNPNLASDRPSASFPGETPPPSDAPVIGEAPQALVDAILDDVVARTGVARDAIKVTRAQAMEWSDGSMGCPEPGMMYTQAIVEGFWVVVEVDARSYDYRAGRQGGFRLCEQPLGQGSGG